jgi:hypothetical protein
MKASNIILWHLAASIILIALYGLAVLIWPTLDTHRAFSIYTAAAFLMLSLIITMSSARLVGHKNPYYFSWVTLMSVLVKLGVGIALVVYYTTTFELDDKLYVISFILAYVIYTVCEVWLLQRIINSVKKSWNN